MILALFRVKSFIFSSFYDHSQRIRSGGGAKVVSQQVQADNCENDYYFGDRHRPQTFSECENIIKHGRTVLIREADETSSLLETK